MLKNYLTIALRNLWRNKIYTLINIFGLGIGLATMVWAVQTYRWSFSFNSMHENGEDVYRVLTFREGSEVKRGIVPLAMGPAAKQDFSSIEEQVRISNREYTMKEAGSEPMLNRIHFVDNGFFDFFNVPLLAGKLDLSEKNTVLLTEETAVKFFGESMNNFENVIGKVLIAGEDPARQQSFSIVGVVENSPHNSSIWFNSLSNIENLQDDFSGNKVNDESWGLFADALFLKINSPDAVSRLATDFSKYVGPQNKARENWKASGFALEPLSEVANHNNDLYSNWLNTRPEDSATYGPLVLAILIFLVCCLNFTNTTIARSNRRLKEMGVRKVMGGTQRQLVWQMLLECGFIVFLGVFVAVEINEYWFPAYNEMWQYLDLEANYLADSGLLMILAGLVIGATLLAGSYPAFYISRFNPTNIFRGSVKFGGSNLFSRILLGLQVTISLMTIIAGVAFSQNASYQKMYDYGFEMENILVTNTKNESMFTAFQNEVNQLANVEMTAGTRHHVGHSFYLGSMTSKGEEKETGYIGVGENYVELMDLELKEGRAFDPNLESDFEHSVLVNEKMINHFGWDKDEVIGQTINFDSVNYSVIGLLKDFHVDDLYSPMFPVMIKLVKPDKFFRLVVRTSPGALSSVQDQMRASWAKLFPYSPMEMRVQSDLKADALQTTENIAWIFSCFAFISALLTGIGFFALVSQTVLNKMKEIAIRKVVGASPRHIFAIVNKGYLWIFIVAILLGCYGGWYATKLLMDMIFVFNVGVGGFTLAISSGLLLMIAVFTVSTKVRHALIVNPSDILKSE